jgi:hypothetical protein
MAPASALWCERGALPSRAGETEDDRGLSVANDIGPLDGVASGPAHPTRRITAVASLLPAQRLMLAILAHALNDLRADGRDDRRARRLAIDANEWFASGDDAWPFSFLAICEMLGLDPSYFRSALRRFRRGGFARDRATMIVAPAEPAAMWGASSGAASGVHHSRPSVPHEWDLARQDFRKRRHASGEFDIRPIPERRGLEPNLMGDEQSRRCRNLSRCQKSIFGHSTQDADGKSRKRR